MATEQTWKIQTWNCERQEFDPEREVTLAQFRAEQDAANARARAIHKANVAALRAETNRSGSK